MEKMEIIKEWVRNIFIIVVALSFIETLLPSSEMQNYIKFIFSLIIMATILSPLLIFLE